MVSVRPVPRAWGSPFVVPFRALRYVRSQHSGFGLHYIIYYDVFVVMMVGAGAYRQRQLESLGLPEGLPSLGPAGHDGGLGGPVDQLLKENFDNGQMSIL